MSRTPVYVEVAEALEAAILRGEYSAGERLPTEMVLSERFGVNRHTAARALNRLQNQGLVRRVERRGTFVNERRLHYPMMERNSFAASIYSQSLKPSHEVLGVRRIGAYGRIVERMMLAEGEPLVSFEQVNYSEGKPIAHLRKYVSVRLLPDPRPWLGEFPSLKTLYMNRFGIEIHRSRMNVRVGAAESDLARHLEVPMGAPVLAVDDFHVYEGRTVQWTISSIRAEAVELGIDLIPPEDPRGADTVG